MAFRNCTGLTSVISHITEPFTTSSGTFMNQKDEYTAYQTSATLYVPYGCKEKYETTNCWSYFKTIVEMDKTDDDVKVSINSKTFPNEKFRQWVYDNCDTDKDGALSEEEIAAVKTLLSGTYYTTIDDMTGIEYFTALEKFNLGSTKVVSLDLSKNTNLKTISCYRGTSLESLDISKNMALENVDVSNTKLTSLDASNHPNLKILNCTNCTLLETLNCSNTLLTALDVTGNTALKTLYCYGNQIKGEAMDALINSLPTVENGTFVVVDTSSSANEKNRCTKDQVAAAKAKGWRVMAHTDNGDVDYEGSEPSEKIAVNEENFPDQYFRTYVSSYIDTDKDGYLSIDEREAVTDIIRGSYYRAMADMTGIEYFMNLETLNLYGTHIKSLDLSKNTALKSFYSYQNADLESLDISKNTALEILNVNNTKLTSLDVTHLTNLKELYCNNLKLGKLDVTNSKGLEVLYCSGNELKELDLSNNLSLKRLNCSNNQLTSLDVSKLTALTELLFATNQLAAIDLSNNLTLEILDCGNNNLKALDVSIFTELKELSCWACGLTNLDVTKNAKLSILYCEYNPLTKLDVSKNTELTKLYCRGGRISADEPFYQLTELDVTQNPKLEWLFCSGNLFTSLDVSKNTALRYLYCMNNQLTTLDVSNNTVLHTLDCSRNQLTTLDVSNNTELWTLNCSENQLPSIDISKNSKLMTIDCSNNQMETLDVSNNEDIGSVYCERNKIKSLKVSDKNTRLGWLHCPGNELKGAAIDSLISNLPADTYGSFTVIDTLYTEEKNVCTKAQVAAFKEKGWTVRVRHISGASVYGAEYEGSDPVNTDLDPVDGGDKINIGDEVNADTNLDGNVVGNILYNISSGDGEFNAQEGCLVINKATSDETMSSLEGKDIFGEDVKDNFTGIVLKVAEGSGKVAIEAETTGPMVLKMKVGNQEPLEMEFEGKLKVKFPYSVTEDTYVYIYGSTKAAQAKGMRRADSSSGSLKIFGIEIEKNPTAIDGVITDNKPMDIYTLSGQKVRSNATSMKGLKAGVYIVGGKKVVVGK